LTWNEVWGYIRLLLRWWYVLLLAVLVSSGTAYYLTRSQPNYYTARASLMIGDSLGSSSPNPISIDLSNTLARFYGELVHRELILKPVAERLHLSFRWQLIADRMLTASVNRDANLLEVTVVDSDPQRVAAIANAVAEQLIAYSPNSPEKIAAQRS